AFVLWMAIQKKVMTHDRMEKRGTYDLIMMAKVQVDEALLVSAPILCLVSHERWGYLSWYRMFHTISIECITWFLDGNKSGKCSQKCFLLMVNIVLFFRAVAILQQATGVAL
ncbi:hypothetical protein Tco_0072087, partial [Tanacetum coccineum]